MLRVEAMIGRTFVREEDRPGGPPVAVLSHPLWQQRFGADRQVVGRSLVLNGQSHTIVGVMPPGFHFLRDIDVWVPLGIDEEHQPQDSRMHYLLVAGRLGSGVSLEQAQTEMDTIAASRAQEHPETNAGWTSRVRLLRENLVGDLRHPLTVLLIAATFVLLIACANVSNLLMVRVAQRHGEIAIRYSLGADRRRLLRQMLIESVLLALLGGAVGIGLAVASLRILPSINPVDVALFRDIDIDLRVLGFTLAVSLLSGLLPGFLSTVRLSTSDLHDRLNEGSQRTGERVEGRRLQSGLVVAEVALALVLLVCAGLLIKSFLRLSHTSPGFDPGNVLTAQISLPEWKYGEPAQIVSFWQELLPRIAALPGVVAAGTTHALPVTDSSLISVFQVEGRPPTSQEELLVGNFRKVSAGFFQAMKIPLIAGRFFTDSDDGEAPPVAIVSKEMAHRYWPDQTPLGRRIRRGRNNTQNPWMTVVGVVGDVQDSEMGADPGATFYVPVLQSPKSAIPTTTLAVRTTVDPLSIAAAIRREILAMDKDQPVDEIATMEERISRSLSKRRFSTLMLTLFSALGISLAAIGIYGVLSYAVVRRSHEMGIRMALGAQVADVIGLVLKRGLSLTLAGLVLGLAMALIISRLLTTLLYGVEPTDPPIFIGIPVGLMAIAGLASFLPAWRASRVDPIVSLKQE
jgi:putative ABC transport system permease protein